MASNNAASIAMFFVLHLLFLTLAAACNTGCPEPKPKPPTTGLTPTPSGPSPSGPSPSGPSSSGKCPIDALKLGVCANVLNGLINVNIGQPPKQPCCSLLGNLVDLEAAVCLCTAIRANILGINLNIPVSLSLLLNYCGKNVPSGFQCR